MEERQEELAFCDERVEKGLVAKLEGIVGSEFVHMDYGEAIQVPRAGEREIRIPSQMGHRPAIRARALSDRKAREEAGHRDETTRRPSKPSTCASTTTAERSRRWTCSHRGSARSSAAASARSASRCWTAAWPSAASTKSTTPGTATCPATAPGRMPA